MKKLDFNSGWTFRKAEEPPTAAQAVTLPHDAMIHEPRDSGAPGGSDNAFFPGGTYLYEKTFAAPDADHCEVLFEGVYRNATVALNGETLATHTYGYTPFSVTLDGKLHEGTNTLTVTVDNADAPSGRWYTGSGIYRPVSLFTGGKAYIRREGIRVTTLSVNPARVQVTVDASGGLPTVELLDPAGRVVAAGSGADITLTVPEAQLWSEESPTLYTCRVTLTEGTEPLDEAAVLFGIRRIEWNARQGLLVNGRPVKLRGACVHHDNGVVGACAFPDSEDRRVRKLKQAGFNAIRSAHNPCSAAMLDACDRYGVYMIDEAWDMWYNHKTRHDYADHWEANWQQDLTAMAQRDYNHPSVIAYSIGNEVSEPAEDKGVALAHQMVDLLHTLDRSRPVTAGINLMIIERASRGQGIYANDGSGVQAQKKKKPKNGQQEEKVQNASLMFNIMASFIGSGMNKAANSKHADAVTTPVLDALDMAGYNYTSGRYEMDGKLHPDRVIYGSETFPQDIAKNWAKVERLPYLVGDFMWTGWDYLGEVGLGAWSYEGGVPFGRPYPWLLSDSGVINILGRPDFSCRYAAAVWGKLDGPAIGVRPCNHPGKRPSRSVWRGTNAIESWSWQGCDGNAAVVEVCGEGASVVLHLNGKRVGRKRLKDKKALFRLRYVPGTLEAVLYDVDGKATGRTELRSAAGDLRLHLEAEGQAFHPGQVVYLPLTIRGENGVVESNADETVTLAVEGGELLGFGSANPCTTDRFDSGRCTTYQGCALAVVRLGSGPLTVTATGTSLPSATLTLTTI